MQKYPLVVIEPEDEEKTQGALNGKYIKYKIVLYKEETKTSSVIEINLSGIIPLAAYLNGYVASHPDSKIINVYAATPYGGFDSNVKFFREEYTAQRWITTRKERVLTTAKLHDKIGSEVSWGNFVTSMRKTSSYLAKRGNVNA